MSIPEVLVIGGRGLVGSALCSRLRQLSFEYEFTARSQNGGAIQFDLEHGDHKKLPAADVIYLVAAQTSTIACEADRIRTWRVNVDAPLNIARSQSGHMEYGRQKAHAEAALAFRPRTAIVRPSRLNQERVADFANFLVEIGTKRDAGLYPWWA